MKIVSKLHDYYDIGASMGIDKSIVYIRSPELVDSDIKYKVSKTTGLPYQDVGVVGFCGKLYPFTIKNHYKKGCGDSKIYTHSEYKFTFDDEDAERIAKSVFIFTERVRTRINRIRHAMENSPFHNDEIFHELTSPAFILLPNVTEQYEAIRLRKAFSVSPDAKISQTLIKNPCLKEVGFYKVVDAFTAFQELSMYMSGVLGNNQQPLVSISDVDMRDAKGFNDHSFKKEPTKRRKK